MNAVTIHYRRDFFGETTSVVPATSAASGAPRGLVGRQVANAEMLAALFRHSSYPQIDFLVDNDADAKALRSLLKRELPAGRKSLIRHMKSIEDWMSKPQRHVIWEPQPPTASLSWARNRIAPSRVALGGVTHALCSSNAVSAIRQLVTSPLRSFDRLVCTSEAVAHTARTLINHWANVVGRTGDPELIQLETIPLGVDCERHRPASPVERAEVRRELQIDDEADVVLFVGRLSHHAKSNPLPMFVACQRAASSTGRPVVLVLAGWYASDVVKAAFESEAARVAPLVKLVHVNGMDARWRDRVWAVADVFVSLADSVQETFGLTVVEAMARGIAVVASDWNGYRETIQHERTGLLVPTTMVEGAGERALIAMHEERLSYDHFLAAVGQTVCVCTAAACDAVERLLCSPELRRQFAEAGARRAQDFSWEKIIARYERLWFEQDRLMVLSNLHPQVRGWSGLESRNAATATVAPSVREIFARYPTTWVALNSELQTSGCALGDLKAIASSPLANHSEHWRENDESIQQLIECVSTISNTPFSIFQARHERDTRGESSAAIADTFAWMMKYDLIQSTAKSIGTPSVRASYSSNRDSEITFTTTCMGRLSHLQQTLPRMVSQVGCQVVVVDYSCPESSGRWVRDNFTSDQVTVVHVPGRSRFNMSEAKNAAISAAKTEWVCLIDADVLLAEDFAIQIRQRLAPKRLLRRISTFWGVGGTFLADREAIMAVGMHDPVYQGWGEEDNDLLDALRFAGHQSAAIPEELLIHLHHSDEVRTQFYETSDRRISHLTNRLYRIAKWDMAKITGSVPALARRVRLYESIRSQVASAIQERGPVTIQVPLGEQTWNGLSTSTSKQLSYKINILDTF